MVGKTDSEYETRTRLLNAAGEVFAEKGFRVATVREICTAANANIAAVNYHFGDKYRLYSEVLRYAHALAMQTHPSPDSKTDATPEARLRAFIFSFLRRVFDKGIPAWREKLMSREMVEPTQALDDLVAQEIKPRSIEMQKIVREIVGPAANAKLIQHCSQSVVAQCLFHYHARPMLERLNPGTKFDEAAIQERAEYIFAFSIAAMRNISMSGSFSKAGKSRTKALAR